MTRLWRHMRRLWPRYTLLPGLPLVLWALLMAYLGMLRVDHVLVALAVIGTAYASPKTKQFFLSFLGFVGVAWFYDAMRFFRNVGVSPERVHLCDLRAAEQSLFGVTLSGQRFTLQDLTFVHHTAALDYLFALPYGIYIFVSMGYGIYLYLADARACLRYSTAFFALNIAAFVTYHLYPAAPPWYFHKFGCVVDLAAASSEGPALARVDAALGVTYFHNLYGRAAEVYGAVPSLHVAYPLLIVFEGWQRHGKLGRALTLLYFALMCAAAVYLDHHWVIDIFAGWAFAIVAFVGLTRLIPSSDSLPATAIRELGPLPRGVSVP